MATGNTTSFEPSECRHCEDAYEVGYNGAYCSERCYYRAQGQSVLNTLRDDHRFCHSCFAKLKEVQRPTDNQLRHIEGFYSTDALNGYQYPTEHATTGEITREPRDNRKEIVDTGIVCGECGATDHRDDFQRDMDISTAAKRLRKRVTEVSAEGQNDWQFDTQAFIETWNEHVGDWAYALGRAIANHD